MIMALRWQRAALLRMEQVWAVVDGCFAVLHGPPQYTGGWFLDRIWSWRASGSPSPRTRSLEGGRAERALRASQPAAAI
jgi:hypothetical protein